VSKSVKKCQKDVQDDLTVRKMIYNLNNKGRYQLEGSEICYYSIESCLKDNETRQIEVLETKEIGMHEVITSFRLVFGGKDEK